MIMIPFSQHQQDVNSYHLKLTTLLDSINEQVEALNDNKADVLILKYKQAWISLPPSISASNEFKQEITQHISQYKHLTPYTHLKLIDITHSRSNQPTEIITPTPKKHSPSDNGLTYTMTSTPIPAQVSSSDMNFCYSKNKFCYSENNFFPPLDSTGEYNHNTETTPDSYNSTISKPPSKKPKTL